MFITRLISGIVLVAIALLVNHVGGPLLLLTMLAISLIGMFELFRAVKIREKGTNWRSGSDMCTVSALIIFTSPSWRRA